MPIGIISSLLAILPEYYIIALNYVNTVNKLFVLDPFHKLSSHCTASQVLGCRVTHLFLIFIYRICKEDESQPLPSRKKNKLK